MKFAAACLADTLLYSKQKRVRMSMALPSSPPPLPALPRSPRQIPLPCLAKALASRVFAVGSSVGSSVGRSTALRLLRLILSSSHQTLTSPPISHLTSLQAYHSPDIGLTNSLSNLALNSKPFTPATHSPPPHLFPALTSRLGGEESTCFVLVKVVMWLSCCQAQPSALSPQPSALSPQPPAPSPQPPILEP